MLCFVVQTQNQNHQCRSAYIAMQKKKPTWLPSALGTLPHNPSTTWRPRPARSALRCAGERACARTWLARPPTRSAARRARSARPSPPPRSPRRCRSSSRLQTWRAHTAMRQGPARNRKYPKSPQQRAPAAIGLCQRKAALSEQMKVGSFRAMSLCRPVEHAAHVATLLYGVLAWCGTWSPARQPANRFA